MSDSNPGELANDPSCPPSSAVPITPHTPMTPNKFKKRNSSVNGGAAAGDSAVSCQPGSATTPAGCSSSSSNNGNNGNTNNASCEATLKSQLEKRGAELAFKSIVSVYTSLERLRQIVPELVSHPLAQIKLITDMLHASSGLNSDELTQIARLDLEQNLPKYQELVSSLSLVEYVCTIDELSPCIMKQYLGKTKI